MKKTYQIPTTVKVKVDISHHLLDNSASLNGSPASVDSESGNYNTLSRKGGFWDDDEDDDY